MRIHLISRDNGAGLSTDMSLLQAMLEEAGHEIHRVDWTARGMERCDVGIFLELMQPRLLPAMQHAIGIFNPEWFMVQWRRYLNNMTQIWSKGVDAHNAFLSLGHEKRAHLTGFLSQDLWAPTGTRQDKCLHLKGHSDLKNTPAILEAWRRNPDLPELIIISNNPVEDLPRNVTLLRRVTNEERNRLMNECYIHLCPSRAEGWAHYITEGLSTGAAVITTDASPMNEQVRPEFGFLLQPAGSHARGMVREYDVKPDDIADAVRSALSMDNHERDKRSALARRHILDRNEAFKNNALRLLGELRCI